MVDYVQVSKNVMEAANSHQAFFDALPERAKTLVVVLEELYMRSWENLMEDMDARLEDRPYAFKILPDFTSTPERLIETISLAVAIQSYEHEHGILFLGEGDSHVPKRVPLDRVPGRNDYDINDMGTAFEFGVIDPLKEKLDSYKVTLGAVNALGIPDSTLEFTPEFMLAVLGHSNDVFHKNAERAPYEGMNIPVHWLTNGQCEESMWRYLVKQHKETAQMLFDALMYDVGSKGYRPRKDEVTEQQFHARFEQVRASGLEGATLKDIIYLDRFFCNQQVSYPVRTAAYRFMVAMEKQGLVERMGHHELASKTWALPGYEKLRELQGGSCND